MNTNLKLINTLKTPVSDTAIDGKSMDELIGRSAKPATERIVPHFEDATKDIHSYGTLKRILTRLSKKAYPDNVTVNK